MNQNRHSLLSNFEEREKIMPSKVILRQFGLQESQHIADLGCGYGFFTFSAAEILIDGKIEAVDIIPERIKAVDEKALDLGYTHKIKTHLTEEETIPLSDKSIDAALIANVLHELNNPADYLNEVNRILVSEGEVWVVEWQMAETPIGPPVDERKSIEEWNSIIENAGFKIIWAKLSEPYHVLIKGVKK